MCFHPLKGAYKYCCSLKKSAAEYLNIRYSFSKYWLQGIDYWINRLNKVPKSHILLVWITLQMVRGWADGWKATVNKINRAIYCWLVQKLSKYAHSPAPGVENETTTNILEGLEANQGRAKVSSYLEGLPDPLIPQMKVQPAVVMPSYLNYYIV
jgi:hypothetical protein